MDDETEQVSLFSDEGMIKSLDQLYENWAEDSKEYKGFKRVCDLKWLSLAIYFCRTKLDEMDEAYKHVDMERWYHFLDEGFHHVGLPILRMSQNQIRDSLWGLEWYLFSDMYNAEPERGSKAWLDEVKHYVNLARYKLYYMAVEPLNNHILDVTEYNMTEIEMNATAEGRASNSHLTLRASDYHTSDSAATEKAQQDAAATERIQQEMRERLERERYLREFERLAAGIEVSAFEERITQVNQVYLYDVNTILHSIDSGLKFYEDHIQSIPKYDGPVIDLSKFRQMLLERYSKTNTIFRVRKQWHCELVIIPSYEALRRREKGRLGEKLEAMEVIIPKMGEKLEKKIPTTYDEFMKQPIGLNQDQWIRVNTDALFFINSNQLNEGDIYEFLYRTQEYMVANPNKRLIARIRVTNQWCHQEEDGSRMLYRSFTEAFVGLRRRMKETDESNTIIVFYEVGKPIQRKRVFTQIDMSQMDDILPI